ncbi:MAG: LysE family translocator [Neomegalonema sp.]|nr:LysE family translocator [Neomegalonema sp.]
MIEVALSGMSWALFIPACFALNMAPGPNNVTAFVNGARLPILSALLASTGRIPAFAVLISITAIGLGAALATSASALWVIKIIGAIYLIYIGVKMLRTRAAEAALEVDGGVWGYTRQDFMFAISNPKAIAIFTAFFPQFLVQGEAVAPQILTMGAAFLALELVAGAIYVCAGRALRGAVDHLGGFDLLQKGVGGFLIFSGVSLAVSNR